jgi:hypothetical protein
MDLRQKLSFKFKLGEIVFPRRKARQKDLPRLPSEVVAIQLGGYIRVRPTGTAHRLLVEADDYERFEEKTQ